jgi:rhamnogalacturonyl hydrolase YesR
MVIMKTFVSILLLATLICPLSGQERKQPQTDANTPLHQLKPDYPVPYGLVKAGDVTAALLRVESYLNEVTPAAFVDSGTGQVVSDLSKINDQTALQPGDFRIVSYEWGVTYAGMLAAADATGDPRFREYVENRMGLIARAAPYFRRASAEHADWGARLALRNLIAPRALDDCGAMCAAMIKAKRAGSPADLRPLIDTHIDYILNHEYRLADGTLARNRPQKNTMWLDDLFMGVPAIAQMGALTGERKYFDEAARQVLAYKQRMFNSERGVFMHGWVEGMTEHPEFFWARANGWAFMTEVELLEVLPADHPSRPQILELLRAHAKGLAKFQSGSGFWHQLLDRGDSYLETSATAIYTYAYARAINRGWIDPLAYGPMTLLAWNAVNTKINARGQVEGTCVGTGMGFDPAFYYFRPTSPFAAHGYGPVLLAGAEILQLLKAKKFEINDSSVQMLAN